MPFRYRLKSGGHADKNAKILDRHTGKLVEMPRQGANPGDIIVYEEDPGFSESDPKRFEVVKESDMPKATGPTEDAQTDPARPPVTDEVAENADPVTATNPPEIMDPEQNPATGDNTEGGDADDGDEADLDSMTVDELKDYAEENEIDLEGARLKDDILKKIKEAEG